MVYSHCDVSVAVVLQQRPQEVPEHEGARVGHLEVGVEDQQVVGDTRGQGLLQVLHTSIPSAHTGCWTQDTHLGAGGGADGEVHDGRAGGGLHQGQRGLLLRGRGEGEAEVQWLGLLRLLQLLLVVVVVVERDVGVGHDQSAAGVLHQNTIAYRGSVAQPVDVNETLSD